LYNELEQKEKIHKWTKKSRVGIYLGQSPTHASTLHLFLLIKTGTVSPQYHVDFDNYIEMTKWMDFMPKSEWQVKPATKEARKLNPRSGSQSET